MPNAAILVGNVNYDHTQFSKLDCCHDDLLAIQQLLEATDKYESITIIEDVDADTLKSRLRATLDNAQKPNELFFYFTGHGYVQGDEFYHCAKNFDPKRPNDTGISTTDLHTLLRLCDAGLVVKVIDACYSGTPLLKAGTELFPQTKDGFRNLIQIASSLESQTSLAGNPLSAFTEKFRAAALRKIDGPVFYTDIISTLRDDFIDNEAQTPFFVSQHTAREKFVDDASRLAVLRDALSKVSAVIAEQSQSEQLLPAQPSTLLERLTAADAKVVTPDLMSKFVGIFFDQLIERISSSEFAEFFDLEVKEHSDFEEATAEQFIIRVMSNEKRSDSFVSARHSRKLRTLNPVLGLRVAPYLDDGLFDETWHLRLNCKMARAQLRITLTPKFTNLQRVVLVVSCAPSLDTCYIFEISTQHMLEDFGKYDPDGPEGSRRWWKANWSKTTDEIVHQITSKFTEVVQTQLESAEKRLSPDLGVPARL